MAAPHQIRLNAGATATITHDARCRLGQWRHSKESDKFNNSLGAKETEEPHKTRHISG
ncbi:hypothetical protein F7P84_13480 [Edwardsiella anguillarum]|nr:hypothetical protein F7P84_13480 [Edwardsiella anguillarum]